MKFITRELYEGLQGEPGSAEHVESERRWEEARRAYRAHVERIRARLPERMRAFADTTLHDGIVRAVHWPSDSELVLDVDATHNPWGPRGVFRVGFMNVRHAEGSDDLVGDDWLYAEVHLHPEARFDFHVMFSRNDFRVVADDVEIVPV